MGQKIISILSKNQCSMKIFCKLHTVNISNRNFWLVICIAKDFKGDFINILILLHPQIPDFQIVVSRPNIVRS